MLEKYRKGLGATLNEVSLANMGQFEHKIMMVKDYNLHNKTGIYSSYLWVVQIIKWERQRPV